LAIAWPRAQGQTPSPTFRAGSDLIVIDAQVVDGTGAPVAGLIAKDFEVRIDGREHRVVAVDEANYENAGPAAGSSASAGRTAKAPASEPPPLLLTAPPTTPAPPSPPPAPESAPSEAAGRTFILAIDAGSFTSDASPGVVAAARQFVNALSPRDEISLVTFPSGPRVDQTSDHVAITQALSGVSGARIGSSSRRYSPGEVVDFVGEVNAPQAMGGPRAMGAASTNLSSVRDAVLQRECGGLADQNCALRVEQDIAAEAGMQEQLGIRSLNQIRDAIDDAGRLPGRKFLVLVSAGLLAADRAGSHPDLGNLPIDVGHAAASANVTVYTLFIDPSFWERYSAETRKGEVAAVHHGRDAVLLARGLDLFTGSAGGAVFQDVIGGGELGFQRVLRETSAGYVLGVEPTDRDRDWDLHEVRVGVKKRGVTVRARQWVRVPRAATP
jgi:VWFA-related protein